MVEMNGTETVSDLHQNNQIDKSSDVIIMTAIDEEGANKRN